MAYACHLINERRFNVALFHPGITNTNIISGQDSSFSMFFKRLGHLFMILVFHTADKATLGAIRAISARHQHGQYYAPRTFFNIFGLPKQLKLPKNLTNNSGDLYDKTILFFQD
jgi:hypothetical protein